MPNVNRYVSEGVGSSIEISIAATDRQFEPFELEVQPGCGMLTVVLTATDLHKPATGILAQVFDPRGELVSVLNAQNAVYARTDAQPGTWTIRITREHLHLLGASAELNASAINPAEFRSTKAPGKLRCGTCKTLLKALVVALLFHLYHWIVAFKAVGASMAYLAKHAPAVTAALALIVPEGLRDKLLDVLKDGIDEPIKRLLQKVCNLLSQCPPVSE